MTNPKHFKKNTGTIPVGEDVYVEVRLRAGRQVCRYRAGYFTWSISSNRMNQGDILSWRLAQ